jgi:hypothetical protein
MQARFQTRFQTLKGKAFGRIEFRRSGDLACKLSPRPQRLVMTGVRNATETIERLTRLSIDESIIPQ